MPAKTESTASGSERPSAEASQAEADKEEPNKEETTSESQPDKGSSGEKKGKGCKKEEILAVLAHELGHWKLSHNLKNLTIGEVSGC